MDLSWLKHQYIAHRGLHDLQPDTPENSMAAFKAAIERGYAIELDVQVIADQQVVVFHDDDLTRMCQLGHKVSTLREGNLAQCTLAGTKETIPLLTDVLKLVNGQVPILIEIKRQPDIKHANMIILNTLLSYKGPLAIQSFDPFIVRWFARYAPAEIRGQLAGDLTTVKLHPAIKYLLRTFKLNIFSRPHFLAVDLHTIPNRLLAAKRRKGLTVLAWTVRTPAAYEQVRPHCDNIIFEGFLPEDPVADNSAYSK